MSLSFTPSFVAVLAAATAVVASPSASAQNPANGTTTTGQTLTVDISCSGLLDESDTSFQAGVCASLSAPSFLGGAQITSLTLAVNGDLVAFVATPQPTVLCVDPLEILQSLDLFGTNILEATATASDGTTVTAVKEVVKTACLLFVGLAPLDVPVVPGAADRWFVSPLMAFHVTEATVPTFAVPNVPSLAGLDVYFQVGMHNTHVFPTDAVQMSNGLRVTIGGPSQSFGTATGLAAWTSGSTAPGGTFEVRFDVLGV
jgi:hypothetical protein